MKKRRTLSLLIGLGMVAALAAIPWAARGDEELTIDQVPEAARAALLERLVAMDEYDFENFVARVLDALGFRNTEVVGRPGDGGVDVRAVVANELVSATVAVQVKRQQSNVGPKEISYLRDRWGRRADKLLFITTSDFTVGAREVATEHDTKPVQLVSGNELADTMIEHRIGVVAHTVERLELDEEFFGA